MRSRRKGSERSSSPPAAMGPPLTPWRARKSPIRSAQSTVTPSPSAGAAKWLDSRNAAAAAGEKALVMASMIRAMRYLVRARVKPGREADLLRAIEGGTLGAGSVAGDEYLRNMADARLCDDGTARWVEVCFCAEPLAEERPYWERYFELDRVQDAHSRRRCRDETGEEPWACSGCDCTARLETQMRDWGRPFLETLRAAVDRASAAPTRGHRSQEPFSWQPTRPATDDHGRP